MTQEVRDWLPLEVITRSAVRDVIAAAVDDWSKAWFTDRRLAAARFSAVRPGGGDGGEWRAFGNVLAVDCSPRAAARLRGWALDSDMEAAVSPVDRQLLDGFERRLLGDLTTKLEKALDAKAAAYQNLTDPFGQHGGLRVEITDEQGDCIIAVAATFLALLPLCKTMLGRRPSPPPLQGLRGALGATVVPLETILGSAQIGLVDLHALAPGDVLVLDTTLQDAAVLKLASSGNAVARGALAERDGAMTLALQT